MQKKFHSEPIRFFALNDNVIVEQDVHKVSSVISAGEISKSSGIVRHVDWELIDPDYVGLRVFFRLTDATRIDINGKEFLAVKFDDLIGFEGVSEEEPDVIPFESK